MEYQTSTTLLQLVGNIPTRAKVWGPNIVTANGEALPKLSAEKDFYRAIHNLGTIPVKYLIDDTQNASADLFHDVLAPGVTEDDGFGAQLILKVPYRVSIFGVGGAPRVAVTRISSL